PEGHALEEPALAEAGEGAPQLGLEEHHQGQHPDRPEVVEEPAGAEQLEVAGQERGHHEARQPEQHLDRPGLLEHDEDPVQHEGDDENVDRVPGPEGLERGPHRYATPPRARAIACATRTACTVSATSCVRTTCAPPSTAAAVAARLPGSRSAASGTCARAPMNDFRETPT